jgi:hypothetical protein
MTKHVFTVVGRGDFPIDMLRYDECKFATDADETAAGIGYISGRRSVTVISETKRPTPARWESYGWIVQGHTGRIDAAPKYPGLKVRVLVGAQAAYACISTTTISLDVMLHGAMGAPASLRRSAQEMRDKAAQLVARAELIEAAERLL